MKADLSIGLLFADIIRGNFDKKVLLNNSYVSLLFSDSFSKLTYFVSFSYFKSLFFVFPVLPLYDE